MPKISVIVPCYNVAGFLPKCLDSLINQTLHDIEIICIDDKSTDNTMEVLQHYATTDSRVKIIAQKQNMGVAMARNTAMQAATGEYIAFMDADDLLPDENVLADMYNAATEHNVKICGGSVIMWNPNTDTEETRNAFDTNFEENQLMKYADWASDYGFWRFIYDRKWLIENNINFPNYIRQEDPVFFVRAMCLAGEFYALRRPTYKYRVSYKDVNWTDQTIKDVFCGLHDCLDVARHYDACALYLNVAKHMNHFIDAVRCVNKNNVSPEICNLIEKLANDMPDDFTPDKFFLNIAKRYKPAIYAKYAYEMIASKRIYLFDLIPLCRIKKTRLFTYVQLLDFIPLMKISPDSRATRYYLFNVIPLIKIKG